ncbi:MAG: peptidylprolyl isomerase [Alphaproteobacteria bacterium]
MAGSQPQAGIDGRRAPARLGRLLAAALAGVVLLALSAAGPLWSAGGGRGAAQAQELLGIAAVVNDQVVSLYDLNGRLRVALAASRLPNTAEVRDELAPRVLRQLIDERLQAQEARSRGISVRPEEIERALAIIREQNRVPVEAFDEFLAANGVPKDALVQQLTSSILWDKLVRLRFRDSIQIGDEEIDAVLERLNKASGKTQSHVYEIFLRFDAGEDRTELRILANRLAQQLRDGANFTSVARQFSDSATVAVGGEIGWVLPGDLSQALDQVIQAAEPGQIAGPIETREGLYLLAIADRRTVDAPDPGGIEVTLRQMVLPLAGDADEAERSSQLALGTQLSQTIAGCDDLAAVAGEMGASAPAAPTTLAMRDLNPAMSDLVASLEPGQVSQPVEVENGVMLVALCDRQEVGDTAARTQVSQQLFLERLGLSAASYLRDLRQAAFIEVRL